MLKKNLGELFNLLICITAIFFLLIYPAYCIEAAKDGLSTALYIVLPSIFPFMVLSRFIISSDLYYSASEFIGKPFEMFFGIPKQYSFVFILGCLGGFPVGSIILSNLLKQKEISVNQAEHLIGICNNASPVFVIGTVGTLLLNSTHYGYIFYGIHIFCTILCGIIMKFIFPANRSHNRGHTKNQKNISPFSEAVTNSGLNMINIASYIIIFSVVSKFVLMLFKNNLCTFLLCILEITTGIKHCASGNMSEILKLSIISFTLGFSGLCVFSQIKSVFGDIKISFAKYFFAKSLSAILSFITAYLFFTIIFSHQKYLPTKNKHGDILILFMLISGSIYLLKSYINSITHAKSFIDETAFTPTENTRFIYNKKGQKLYADFIFKKNSNYVAVLYIGYGLNPVLSDKLKSYYIQNKFNVVLICANGFGISGKNKKTDDCVLAEELENWILIIKDTFGKNSKIILHGFSYTALATLNCAKYCTGVAVDNTYLSTIYNYKDLTSKILKHMYKNKSRGRTPGINVPVFFSSENKLSKETYKLYEISASKKYVYIYDLLNPDEYINKLNKFIKHIKPPEE